MKKIILFLSVILIGIAMTSCSKTRDGLGLDTIDNNARTGKWKVSHLTYVTGVSDPVEDPVFENYNYAEFKSDDKVHYFDSHDVDVAQDAYSFLDTKSIMLDGDRYDIQENLAGSFSKMTLQRNTATGKEVYIFER